MNINTIIQKDSPHLSPGKRSVRLRLLLAFVLVVSSLVSLAPAASAATFTPAELDSPLNNPFKGWAPPAAGGPYAQPHKLVYAGVTWKELEPTKGVFDWDGIEAKFKFDYWRSQGVRVVFRLLLDNPTGAPHRDIPDWLYNEMLTQEGTAGTAYQDNTGGMGTGNNTGFSPNYSSPILIARHKVLLDAIAARYYTQDAPIAFVQIGSLGHWGEFHTWPYVGPNNEQNYTGVFPPNAISDQFIQHYIDAFSNKSDRIQVMIRRSVQLASTHRLGMFNDVFGDKPSFDSSWGWYTGTQNGYWDDIGQLQPAYPNFWDHAISAGEFYGGAGGLQASLTSGAGFTETMRQAELSKPSWLGPNSPASYTVGGPYQANIDTLKKRMGYHLVVKQVTHNASAASDSPLSVSLSIENKGLQHFPFNWPVELQIRSGSTVVARAVTDIQLKDWKTGAYSHTDSITIPSNLPAGTYTVALAILDPATNTPAVDFANTGRTADGAFPVSTINVTSESDGGNDGGGDGGGGDTSIVVDGSASDWNDIPALASGSSLISALKGTRVDSTLHLLVQGSGLTDSGAFYINADNNNATGYNATGWPNSSADYLLENNTLYAYTGTGNSWSWNQVATLGTDQYAKNASVVEIGLPLSLIGVSSGQTIRVGYILAGSTTERLPAENGTLPTLEL
ncbi:DUF4832 domain-containing protein [Paenibacillus sanguinis]|uniref:DUF4832 domain-containing protein n=1 Tax=Paenibacillus sanguinis TaxID=225906 RepID=UPI00037FAC42|nr:DUF4832 domain-containing protein [Paenibacillus sanguinis]